MRSKIAKKIEYLPALKNYFRNDADHQYRKEILARFEDASLTIKVSAEWDELFLIEGVPVILSKTNDFISFVDENYWYEKINLTTLQQNLLKKLPRSTQFKNVEKVIEVIKNFLKDNPIYSSDKANRANNKTGAFENVQTFENWKESEKLRDINKKSGVFEDPIEEVDGEEWVNDCFINHNNETAEIIAEEGKLKVGVIYDENSDPSLDQITLELSDIPSSGYVTIHVNELRKLLQTAHAQLDNFPKVI